MRVYFLFLSFSAVLASISPNNRRHLVPKTLAQKLCEQDNTLTICSLPEVTPPKNPVSIWKTCEHQPHILLCRYKPPASLPMYKIIEATTNEPELERVALIEVEELEENPRRALMEKVIGDIFKEKTRRQQQIEESFDDSIMMGNGNIFEGIRLI